MSEPFMGEIAVFSSNFAPRGWALCNGQLLPIQQNQALFSLLGTTYGGNGQTNFALPNLQGRVPIHTGSGFTQGQAGGTETVNLSAAHTAHGHSIGASTAVATLASPAGNVPATSAVRSIAHGAAAGGANTSLNAAALSATVSTGQAHPNMQPSLVLNFCIALQGIFPSQN
jgi:microcystin-dependent protein